MSTEHPADRPAPISHPGPLPIRGGTGAPSIVAAPVAPLDTTGAPAPSPLALLDVAARMARTLAAGVDALEGLRRGLAVLIEGLGWEGGEVSLCDPAADPSRQVVAWGASNNDPEGRGVICRLVIERGGAMLGALMVHRRTGVPDTTTLALLRLAAAQMAQFLDHCQAAEARERQLAPQRELGNDAAAALASVSHELRAPLNAMLGWSRLLRSGVLDAETVARGLAAIERNGEIQEQLICDLVDVAHIMRGQLQPHPAPTDLGAVVESAVDAICHLAALKGVVLDVVVAPQLPPTLADGDQLRQIVGNLLTNAVRASPEGGRVSVRVRSEEDRAVVQVSDDGAGIAPDRLPHAFEPFRHTHTDETRRRLGLGLGLSIVRHLTELQGGRVRAESPGEGRGSTFTVELPLAEAPTVDMASPPSAPVSGPRLEHVRILLVDDDVDGRELLGMLLEERGATVTMATSVQAALTALDHDTFDVVLSDIGLPDADGYELIRALRSSGAASARTAVAVALTGWARAEDRDAALEAGFQAHVVKPVDPDELAALLAQLVTERRSGPVTGTGIAGP